MFSECHTRGTLCQTWLTKLEGQIPFPDVLGQPLEPCKCLASCWFTSPALVLLDVQRLLETIGGLLAAELVAEWESEVATLALANHNCRAACARSGRAPGQAA